MSVYRHRGFFFFFFLSSPSKFPPRPCLNHRCRNVKNVCILKKEKRALFVCPASAFMLVLAGRLSSLWTRSECISNGLEKSFQQRWSPRLLTPCVYGDSLHMNFMPQPWLSGLKRHICSRFGVYCSRFSWQRSRNELFSGFFLCWAWMLPYKNHPWSHGNQLCLSPRCLGREKALQSALHFIILCLF